MTRSPTPLLQACAARGIVADPGFKMAEVRALLYPAPNAPDEGPR